MKKKMEKLKSVVKLTCLPFVAALCLAAVSCGNLSGDLANIKDAPISLSNVLYNADGTPNNGGTWKARSGRIIDNEHPLFMNTFYAAYTGGDIWAEHLGVDAKTNPYTSSVLGWRISESPLVLDGYKMYSQDGDTLLGRWNSIPDHIKPYTALVLHSNMESNGWGGNNPYAKAWYEALLKVGDEQNIPMILVCYTASKEAGFNIQWATEMVSKHKCIEGFFSTESFWSGGHPKTATVASEYIKMGHEKGIYFFWSDGNPNSSIEQYCDNDTFRETIKQYGKDNFIWIYKNTRGVDKQDLADISYMQGFWLSGLVHAWGGLMDNWKRNRIGEGSLYKLNGGGGGEQSLLCEPEAAIAQQMSDIWAGGGCVYTYEHPSYSIGIMDKTSPLSANVIYPMLNFAISEPAPSKEKIAEETKIFMVADISREITGVANNPSFYVSLGMLDAANWHTYVTGRFGSIPFVPKSFTGEYIKGQLQQVPGFKGEVVYAGASGTAGDLYNKIKNPSTRKAVFEQYYPQMYEGNAFAAKVSSENTVWIMYNSIVNKAMSGSLTLEQRIAKESSDEYAQWAKIPVGNGAMKDGKIDNDKPSSMTLRMTPHIQVMLQDEVNEKGSLSVFLDNYRAEHNEDVYGKAWNENGRPGGYWRIHDYIKDYYIDNPKSGRNYEFHWRTTDFTIHNLSSLPVVKIDKGLSLPGQYDPEVSVSYNPDTKEARFSIKSNGYVYLEIMDLQFANP